MCKKGFNVNIRDFNVLYGKFWDFKRFYGNLRIFRDFKGFKGF